MENKYITVVYANKKVEIKANEVVTDDFVLLICFLVKCAAENAGTSYQALVEIITEVLGTTILENLLKGSEMPWTEH